MASAGAEEGAAQWAESECAGSTGFGPPGVFKLGRFLAQG